MTKFLHIDHPFLTLINILFYAIKEGVLQNNYSITITTETPIANNGYLLLT